MTLVLTDDAYDKKLPCVLFDNALETGNVTADTAAEDYPAENAVSGMTWDAYKPTHATQAEYMVDMGADYECDCALVDAHTLASVGGSITISGSDDALTWVDMFDATDVDDSGAFMAIWRGVEYRYWKFTFNYTSPPEIGVLMIGKRLVFPNGIASPYQSIPHSIKYTLLGGNTDGGQFTGNMVIRQMASVSPTFPLLDAEWVDNEMKPFEYHYNTGLPFAWAANPAFDAGDIGYCYRPSSASELNPSYYEGGMYEEFTMRLGVFVNA